MDATVRSPGLHLRMRASHHARIKDSLNYGDKLILIGTPDRYNWQCVRVQRTGSYGYVYSPYIRTMSATKTVSKPVIPAPATEPAPIAPKISSTVQPPPNPDDGTRFDIGTIMESQMRRVWAAAVIPILLLASLALSADAPLLHDLTLPDPIITPGAVRPLAHKEICETRWGLDHRAVTAAMKREVFHRYGLTGNTDASQGCRLDKHGRRYEIDHRVPRSLAGQDSIPNLWSECYSGRYNANNKDKLEVFIGRAYCRGDMTLEEAQGVFLGTWIEGYRKYIGEPLPHSHTKGTDR